MRGKRILFLMALGLLLCSAGCTDESKINGVKKTVVQNCGGKTMQDLASGLLQNPVWGIEKGKDGKEAVTLKGTVAGDKLPDWVKEQKLMDATFRFPLDPKTDAFDPAGLEGFPSLTAPEGVFQAYKALVCS